jgi:hypothetical protein
MTEREREREREQLINIKIEYKEKSLIMNREEFTKAKSF